jgi:UDP-galactopyranose mutase
VRVKIIGCGLSGVTAAILLKEKGHSVEIFESRNHIGGNCYDSNVAGTLVHNYGPHCFHTNDESVFSFLSKFTDWKEFYLRPKGNTELGLISLPYSKTTVQELGRELSEEEIIEYIFKGYSEKQWGVSFNEIPKSIINRIPKVATKENPSWAEGEKYQCIPIEGYTKMFENMLHNIKVHLGVNQGDWRQYDADLTIYTGKIDEYFDFCFGGLPYRSLYFEHTMSYDKMNTFIINQNKREIPYTRIYDHSYFTPNHKGPTIITKEYSIKHTDNNIPFYPMPFGEGSEIYLKYNELAKKEKNVIFIGRLATYKYLDMWMAVKQAMQKVELL